MDVIFLSRCQCLYSCSRTKPLSCTWVDGTSRAQSISCKMAVYYAFKSTSPPPISYYHYTTYDPRFPKIGLFSVYKGDCIITIIHNKLARKSDAYPSIREYILSSIKVGWRRVSECWRCLSNIRRIDAIRNDVYMKNLVCLVIYLISHMRCEI